MPTSQAQAEAAINDICVITDSDQSASAIDYILKVIKPEAMAVCCYGEHLGTEKSNILLVVLVLEERAYIYDGRQDNGELIKDGGLKELFKDQTINKVHRFR